MNPASVKNVLFDLDGTLTDPVEGITRCIQFALEKMSAPQVAREELLRHIGPPLRGTFSQILQTNDEETIEKAVGLYRERFSEVGMFENEIYEGVPEMLASLQSASKRLFVATSKMEAYARRIVEHFALSGYFARVYGSAPDGRFDNKAELIGHILTSEGLAPGETLMVGDRKYDVAGAKANDCLAAGVTYGYGTVRELEDAGADYVCRTPGEIVDLLADRLRS